MLERAESAKSVLCTVSESVGHGAGALALGRGAAALEHVAMLHLERVSWSGF